jgi:hypothetical protein
MYKAQWISILLVCLCSLHALAQKNGEFKVELPERVDPIITNGFYIKSVEMDPNAKGVIGSAQVGINKIRVEAVISEPAEINFLRTSNQLVPPSQGAMPLKLIINKIRIDETTTLSSETGTASLTVTIVGGSKENEKLTFYNGTATSTQGSLIDVSKGFGKLISDALADILTEFSNSDWKSRKDTGLSDIEIEESILSNTFPPHTEALKEGIYLTSKDLMLRQPSARTAEILYRNSLEDKRFKLKFTDGEKAEFIFAAYIDSSLYVSENLLIGGKAVKKSVVKFKEGTPYWYTEVTIVDAVAQQFGLVGSAMGTRAYGVVLDIRTGNVFTLTDDVLINLTEDHSDLNKYISDNRKLKPIGSRKIIKALNERLSESE